MAFCPPVFYIDVEITIWLRKRTLVKLGLSTYGTPLEPEGLRAVAQLAESAGYDSIWTGEAWVADAFTPLAFVAAATTTLKLGTAIAQLSARTPGTTAMTALTLQQLSGGRLILGLGVSGPQVVEGWHGVPFRTPVKATREYIAILRQALAGEKVDFQGDVFQVPYRGDDASGLGRSLRTSLPTASDMPILVAALGPRNLAMATEVADGLLPYLWSPNHWRSAFGEALDNAPGGFKVMPTVAVALGDDLQACRDEVRPKLTLHIGGMGSKDKNFYKSLVERYGFEEEAERIQSAFLSGDRAGALAATSDALVDELALVGPAGHVSEQLEAWKRSPIDTLIIETARPEAIEQIASLV
jgi:F420-dependent oxidoreductase-like protein